jgi:hypothetical protein
VIIVFTNDDEIAYYIELWIVWLKQIIWCSTYIYYEISIPNKLAVAASEVANLWNRFFSSSSYFIRSNSDNNS